MKHLKAHVTNEIIIKKSRFITHLFPLTNEEEISVILSSLRKQYPKATHYCTAYMLGNNGQFGGSNDDGEPAGTAGIPMLEVLKFNNLTNVLAVVIRYYGGIQLGAGGLIRAYSNSVSQAVKLGAYFKYLTATKYEVHFNYDQINEIEYLLSNYVIISREFQTHVIFTIAVTNNNNFDEIKHHFFDIKKPEDLLLAIDI